jgi:Uma2 family endonuclease
MADPKRRRAGYEDVLRAPEHMVAEVIEGDLHLSPRPGPAHASAYSALVGELRNPFGRGKGGPGGWIIIGEPELHLGSEPAILVPDVAGWRRERMPSLPQEAFFALAPDWVCEVVSPSTGRFDRIKKLPFYATQGIGHAWLVDPLQRTLEVFRNQGGRWTLLSTHADEDKVRAEPFDAIELELSALWADVQVSS